MNCDVGKCFILFLFCNCFIDLFIEIYLVLFDSKCCGNVCKIFGFVCELMGSVNILVIIVLFIDGFIINDY